MKTKQFYFKEYNDTQMQVWLLDFQQGPLPLIWKSYGEYGLIPVEIIANIIDYFHDHQDDSDLSCTIPSSAIVIEIPKHIAKMLCTEQSEDSQSQSRHLLGQ